jgi:hypothetical protein
MQHGGMQIGRWNFSDSVAMLSLVRRQSFWDRERLKLREFLAPLVNDVKRLALGNCLAFDPFPFDQDGLASPEVNVGGA